MPIFAAIQHVFWTGNHEIILNKLCPGNDFFPTTKTRSLCQCNNLYSSNNTSASANSREGSAKWNCQWQWKISVWWSLYRSHPLLRKGWRKAQCDSDERRQASFTWCLSSLKINRTLSSSIRFIYLFIYFFHCAPQMFEKQMKLFSFSFFSCHYINCRKKSILGLFTIVFFFLRLVLMLKGEFHEH